MWEFLRTDEVKEYGKWRALLIPSLNLRLKVLIALSFTLLQGLFSLCILKDKHIKNKKNTEFFCKIISIGGFFQDSALVKMKKLFSQL